MSVEISLLSAARHSLIPRITVHAVNHDHSSFEILILGAIADVRRESRILANRNRARVHHCTSHIGEHSPSRLVGFATSWVDSRIARNGCACLDGFAVRWRCEQEYKQERSREMEERV